MTIDTSRALRSRGAYSELVKSIITAPVGEPETLALEWKTGTPLLESDTVGRISKAILAFANRDPDAAARHFGGCAYLVIGAEPGSVSGIARVDFEQPEKKVRVYTGPGPDWEPRYVEAPDGTAVLVVTIEPSKWGDPIHPLRRTFEETKGPQKATARNGTIYVRHPGRSEMASATDIDTLCRRAAKTGNELQIELLPNAAPLRPLTAAEISTYIETERERLLGALPDDEAPTPTSRVVEMSFASAMRRDLRTQQDYRQEVEQYLEDLRKPDFRRTLQARSFLHKYNALELAVRNNSEHGVRDLVVVLEVPSLTVVTGWPYGHLAEGQKLPNPPLVYGTPTLPGRPRRPRDIPVMGMRRPEWPANIERSDDLTRVRFQAEDVPPGDTVRLPLTYWLPSTSEAVQVTWSAGGYEARGRISGAFSLTADAEELSIEELLATVDN